MEKPLEAMVSGGNTLIVAPGSIDDMAEQSPVGCEVLYGKLRIDLFGGGKVWSDVAQWPALCRATPEQQANWEPCAAGHGIHWPDLDVDISIRALFGRPT